MKPTILLSIFSLSSSVLSLPHEPQAQPDPTPNPHIKRQNGDFSALLELASLAGIPVPTDPAVLLSIAPLAASLNSLLPTASVLSALETAAPSGLLSSLVHDPPFAQSWISSFEKGPSPSWFLALPTGVRSYLHTYAGGGNLGAVATAAEGIQSVESAVSSQLSVSRSASSVSSTGSVGSAGSAAGNATITGTMGGNGTAASSTLVGVTTGSSSSTGDSGSTGSSTSALSSSLSTAGAARETGVFAVGAVAMAGILGLAVAL